MDENEKHLLITNAIQKAERALTSADFAIRNSDIDTAANRIYYAIFYSVLALGYKHEFATSKHGHLMGWFNKKFIHEEKIFTPDMYQVYRTAFDNRQETDYNLLSNKTIDIHEMTHLLEKANDFLVNIKGYLHLL